MTPESVLEQVRTRVPPLANYFSDTWIAGAADSLVTASGQVSDVMSAGAGELLGLGELADLALANVPDAVQSMVDLGENVLSILQSGDAFTIVGWAATAIKLFYGRLAKSLAEGAAQAQSNALRVQWDIAGKLVLRRTARAVDLPGQWGGGNFTYVQPGVKKDWPQAAFPPVLPRTSCVYDKKGKPTSCVWREPILFTHRSPNDMKLDLDCFSLGSGKCEAPPESVIGLSFLTWPWLVEVGNVPWGGGHLIPYFALLTSPTVLHVQVRQADVDALRARMRQAMRQYWNIRVGPPISEVDVTVWPDGAYVAPGQPDMLIGAAKGLYRYGETPEKSILSPEMFDLEFMSQAFRSLARWQECRIAALRYFDDLPQDVRLIARTRNPDDFSDEEIDRWAKGRP